jgi:SAM-dependent methyltransferase
VNTAAARAMYEAWHLEHDVDRAVDTPWHRLLLRHIDVPRDIENRRVMEIACGRGGLARLLAGGARRPRRFVAADFSRAAVEKGRAFGAGIRCLTWSVTDLQAVAFRDASFDTVVSCESLEHVERPLAALQELYRVMRSGGRLYLTTPNYLGPLGVYRGYARLTGRPYTEGGQPINHYMLLPRTCAWMRRAGFLVRLVDGVGHYLPWPGRAPIEWRRLERVALLRWVALHSLVVAERP